MKCTTLTRLHLALVLIGCSATSPATGPNDDGGPDDERAGGGDAATTSEASSGDDAPGDRAVADGGAYEGGAPPRPLGTLTVVSPSISCPPGAPPGAACSSVSVACPNVAEIGATIAVAEPAPGVTPRGTIVGHAGGGGGGFFSAGPEGKGFERAFAAAGFRYVEIAWAKSGAATGGDWASSGAGSIKAAACRPATALRWMFDRLHGGSRSSGFCGIGTSGGSAALTYSLLHYGLHDVVDYLALGAGPAPARIDYGCEPSLYKGPPRSVCPELPDASFTYRQGTTSIANGWEGTSSCGWMYKDAAAPSAADVSRWSTDSVVSEGGTFDLPRTGVSYWFCTSTPNETPGQGSFVIEQLHPKNDPLDVHCYGGPTAPSPCTQEYVFEDPAAFALAVSEMTSGCVPNH